MTTPLSSDDLDDVCRALDTGRSKYRPPVMIDPDTPPLRANHHEWTPRNVRGLRASPTVRRRHPARPRRHCLLNDRAGPVVAGVLGGAFRMPSDAA